MNKPTPEQLKKLERLAKVIDGGDIALLNQVIELDEKLDEIARKTDDAVSVAKETRKMKGDKGERGEKGDTGKNGRDGKDGKRGKDGRDGKDGKRGKDGRDGTDGLNGIDGKDGKDGFIDDATIGYLEDEIKRVEDKIDTLPSKTKETNFGFVIRDVVAGTGVTIDKSDPNRPVVSASASTQNTYETVSKNLDASDATLNYTGDNLTSIDYTNGITKTLNYTGDNLTSVVLSGSTPSGIDLTKTLTYTGDNLTGVAYS